jgi:hypothetical protein
MGDLFKVLVCHELRNRHASLCGMAKTAGFSGFGRLFPGDVPRELSR